MDPRTRRARSRENKKRKRRPTPRTRRARSTETRKKRKGQPIPKVILECAYWGTTLDKVKGLLPDDADIDDADSDGFTSLLNAVKCNHAAIVKYLVVKRKANVNLASRRGHTALMYAVENNQHGTVALLLAHGASATAQNTRGLTALHMARHPDVVDMLVGAGADVDVVSVSGYTALVYAEDEGDVAVVDALIRAGASKNP